MEQDILRSYLFFVTSNILAHLFIHSSHVLFPSLLTILPFTPLPLFFPTILISNHYFFTVLLKSLLFASSPSYELFPFHSSFHFSSWFTVFLKFCLYVEDIQCPFKHCISHLAAYILEILNSNELHLYPKSAIYSYGWKLDLFNCNRIEILFKHFVEV